MSVFIKPSAVAAKKAIAIELVAASAYATWLKAKPVATRNWLATALKDAKAGQHVVLPSSNGAIDKVVAIISDPVSIWDIAGLSKTLPEGTYSLQASGLKTDDLFNLALGYGLGAYQFTRYKKAKRISAALILPKELDVKLLEGLVSAQNNSRDLINTPAEDLGPPEMAATVAQIAKIYGAKIKLTSGAALKAGFPLVYAVGRAASKPSQLIDMTWQKKGSKSKAPKVTLVGKGVCFDTGGLNIKTRGMGEMKADMGGGAVALATAQMIMAAGLDVQLRVIIPAVENAVSSNSIRPSDVVKSRAGIMVEIQDTDAEGRLILADALALAAEGKPDLIIDMATLTGAKYGLLGKEIGSIHSNKVELAQALQAASFEVGDPLWHMPMWPSYMSRLDSVVADTLSCADGGVGDTMMAAMFLQKFVGDCPWLHLDIDCLNAKDRAGRPEGGEAQAARALYRFLQQRFG